MTRIPSLHKLPKYKTNIQGLRVGSGELLPAHFLDPCGFQSSQNTNLKFLP